jgi:hypothetical protein
MNSDRLKNESMQNSLVTSSPLPAFGEVASALKMPLVEGFLENLSEYSAIYTQLDDDRALTKRLYVHVW